MITGDLKSQVDKIWEAFWTGGISNPLTVIEQFTFLLFLRRVDEQQQAEEQEVLLLGLPLENPSYSEAQKKLRWHAFKEVDPEAMFALFTQPQADLDNLTAFEFMKQLGSEAGVFAKYMKGATFMIPTPKLLDQVVQMIAEIKMENRDTKGDLYEYLLSKIATAGTNGQFRTPRHIIKMMVEMMRPSREDTVCDPACGSAGFLVAASEYFHNHDADAFHDVAFSEHFNRGMFTGMEFDSTMLRIGAMNLQLHGIDTPQLLGVDALSEVNDQREAFSLILANPPFKGSLDYDGVEGSLLTTVKTKKTELLFLALMLRMLKVGGRCAVIVPDGVLFGSSKAHKKLRQTLVEGQKLDAVISMPSGVFKPYAGVSTAILIFTKTNSGGTDRVWFYDMQADGFSLDDKRAELEASDLADIIERFQQRDEKGKESERKRTEQSFLVPFEEIKENEWDLSINRYKEIVYEEVKYAPPAEIIAEIEQLDQQR
ncbi:MAG: class I SAM-dependent DNA methyltransferase, partial [Gammaproteobacteria bacterium]|nr:class I SAM-dependent DNA methyltransferase [Gammaproteobacteria bacterium]